MNRAGVRRAAALAAAAVLAACAVAASDRPPPLPAGDGTIAIEAHAVPFHAGNPEEERAGRLRFRGGLALSSSDARFGGLSGLHVSPDGVGLTAISDKGRWFQARLRYDAAGRLAGVDAARIGDLRDMDGRSLVPQARHDAESLARLPGGWAVGFEGAHRIWLYPDGDENQPFAGRPRALPQPPGLNAARGNLGIEALAALPDGRRVALTEGLAAGPDSLRGWVAGRDGAWRPIAWPRTGLFAPSDATALPDGDLLVLERRFTFVGGFAARLVRVKAAALDDPVPRGEELGIIAPPHTVDNFEGVAARKGPRGETLIYLLADDNFHPLERTLLLMFELLPAG